MMLQYLAPPVLGAFIGYMTNYVAIRMLFRPLRPWKVMGRKLPLTPGVIPAKRKKLAGNIGEMVGTHLLTTEDVGRALNSSQFQEELGRLIDAKLEDLLGRDLGSINDLIPDDLKSIYSANVRVLKLRLRNRLHAYLDSDDFTVMIEKLIMENSSDLFTQKTVDAFPEEKREAFFSLLEDILSRLLANPAVRDIIADIIKQKINGLLDNRKSIADLVSTDILTVLLDRLEEEASPLLARLAELLKEPRIQKKISVAIAETAGSFTSSLGPLGAMLGSVLNPETIREKIASFMEEKGETIGGWLESDEIREETARIIREKAETLCNRPLADFLKKLSREKTDEIVAGLSEYIAGRLARPETAGGITNCLSKALTSQDEREIGEIAADVLGPEGVADYRQRAVGAITSTIRSNKVKNLADGLMVELLEKQLLNKRIGPLANLVPDKLRLSIRGYIKLWSSTVLSREVPNLVDSLNIKEIVARKVNSLDILRLEGLLMSIMQEQFKYINLFGGLLGLIIGLLNLIFII